MYLQTSCIVNCIYHDFVFFFYRLLDTESHADVEFDVHGEKFGAHRCILVVRCPYFAELFRTKWQGRNKIELKHQKVGFEKKLYLSMCFHLKKKKKEFHLNMLDI